MAQRITKRKAIKVCHLYPDLMDTYGDSGNIIAIEKRCDWRKINVTIVNVSLGDKINDDFDFYFFGGGQDKAQYTVARDLKSKAKTIKKAVENGSVLLSICGGYQLLQNYFKTKEGEKIEGIGLFDAHTIGSNDRMIQNLLISLNSDLNFEINKNYQTTKLTDYPASHLIGFENHSGKTFLGESAKPLGEVISGSGNNGEDKTEGAWYKNAFGCYLHGSLLPKNPHFADYLIFKSLERKYGKTKLDVLNDTLEWNAFQQTIKRIRSGA